MDYVHTALVTIHILSAIIGVGPVFFFNTILGRAKNSEQLIYAHQLVETLNRNANVGFSLLLITGLAMGWKYPALFRMFWYDAALVLFLISGFYAVLVTEPKLKRLHEIAKKAGSGPITQEYKALFSIKSQHDVFANVVAIAIILLMVVKP